MPSKSVLTSQSGWNCVVPPMPPPRPSSYKESAIPGTIMRLITIADGVTVRFPTRSQDFDEGVEIGVIAGLMASGIARFDVRVARETLEQARSLAEGFGYRVATGGGAGGAFDGSAREGDEIVVTFLTGAQKPRLQVVRS